MKPSTQSTSNVSSDGLNSESTYMLAETLMDVENKLEKVSPDKNITNQGNVSHITSDELNSENTYMVADTWMSLKNRSEKVSHDKSETSKEEIDSDTESMKLRKSVCEKTLNLRSVKKTIKKPARKRNTKKIRK